MSITVTGEWRSLPVEPPEQIKGVEIFKQLCSLQGRYNLSGRELAATFMRDDGQEYTIPRLWLRWDESEEVAPAGAVPCLKLVFASIPAPWLTPMEFYCDPVDGQTAANNGLVIRTLTIGYPRYQSEFVVTQTAA